MEGMTAGFINEFYEMLSAEWEPPPNLSVSEWADLNRVLPAESSPEAGRWRTSRTPYLREPMDKFFDPMYDEHVWMFGSQLGKTEGMLNICGYIVDMKPSPVLTVQPTIDMGKQYSNDRLTPTIRDSKTLSEKIDIRSRRTGNNILYKSFAGGYIAIAGANSAASLASRPVRYVLADEIDRYPASVGEEGDPVRLAEARTANYDDSGMLLTSTPTNKNASRIEAAYEGSQQYEYYVPCPHCGSRQTLKWKNRVIPQDKDGNYLTDKIFFACEENGCEIHEQHKQEMLSKGEWRLVKSGPIKRRVGYRINSIYSPWLRWRKLAELFVEAREEPDLLKTFVNTKLAETWELRTQAGLQLLPSSRCEDYDLESLNPRILFVTCAIDKQRDRLEILTQGWGEKRERWNLETHVIWGDTSALAVYDELDSWLKNKTYKVGSRELSIAITGIDSGDDPQPVYDFVKPRQGRRVFALKGSSKYYTAIANKGNQVGRQRVTLFEIGTDTAKDQILYSSLQLPKPDSDDVYAGYIHFPKDWEQELFDQLSMSEYRRKNTGVDRLGRKKRITRLYEYEKLRERNEQLDLHVYNLALYYILNPDIDVLKAKAIKADSESNAGDKEASSTGGIALKRTKRKKKNWVNDI